MKSNLLIIMKEINSYIMHYSSMGQDFSFVFWIQLILQIIAFVIILKYYMRNDYCIKIITVAWLPMTIYFLGYINYGVAIQSLAVREFRYAEDIWNLLNGTNIQLVTTEVIIVLLSISIMLEKRLFDDISEKVGKVSSVIIRLDTIINVLMAGYCIFFCFRLMDQYDNNFYCCYLYGTFTLIIQLLVKYWLIALGAIEGDKSAVDNIETTVLDKNWCKKKVKKYITSSYRIGAITFSIIMAFIIYMLFVGIRDEGISLFDAEAAGIIVFICIFIVPFIAVTIYFYKMWLFPGKNSCWKRIETWGNESEIYSQICSELFNDRKPPMKTHYLWISSNFIVFPVTNCRKIYYIPYYVGQSQNGINRTYNFSDGSKLKLDLSTKKRQEYANMLDLVLGEKEQLK